MRYGNAMRWNGLPRKTTFQGNLDFSRTAYLFPPNMPLRFEHNGTYVCIATNKYGSTSRTITIDGNVSESSSKLSLGPFAIHAVLQTSEAMSITTEPASPFAVNTEVAFNCQFPDAERIWWSSINHRRRASNPLRIRLGANATNKRFVCHARDVHGKLHRKIVRIQRHSSGQLVAVVANNTIERNLIEQHPKSTASEKVLHIPRDSSFALVKPSEIYIKLVTASDDIRQGESIDIYCYVEGNLLTRVLPDRHVRLGQPPRQLSWSFQSGLLPSNTQLTSDGHLLIYNFDRFNLGTYTCSVDTSNEHLSRSIDFHSETFEPGLSLQVYSSRSDYHFAGHLFLQCVSSGTQTSTSVRTRKAFRCI